MQLLKNSIFCVCLAFFTTSCGGGGGSSSSNNGGGTPANSAPRLSQATPNLTAEIGVTYQLDFQNVFIDSDGDTLTYSLNVVPDPGAQLIFNANGTATVTPTTSGTYTANLTATDPSGASSSDSFNIIVTDPIVATDKPNILFIISDDQGQDSSAQYGFATSGELPDTPTLNALASDGLVFDNAWVTPLCAPTRATLLTGKYSFNNGVTGVTGGLNVLDTDTHDTLFDYYTTHLTDYTSALIGKWHLGGGNTGPASAGIDHYAVINSGGVSDYESWSKNTNGVSTTSTTYVTTDFTDEAISWIGDQTDPWFLWLAHIAPHTPFHVPPTSLQSRVTTATGTSDRELYLAAIEAMDSEIGRLLGSLSAQERANTLIFYLGDNGTPNQVDITTDILNGSKGGLLEGGMRVPLIASGNGVTRTGREAALINSTDFYNTIVELSGGTANSALPNSQSFAALLTNSTASSRNYIFTENLEGWAIRDNQYKLITYTDGRTDSEDLFDLINDPDESADLLDGAVDVSAIRAQLIAAKPN